MLSFNLFYDVHLLRYFIFLVEITWFKLNKDNQLYKTRSYTSSFQFYRVHSFLEACLYLNTILVHNLALQL